MPLLVDIGILYIDMTLALNVHAQGKATYTRRPSVGYVRASCRGVSRSIRSSTLRLMPPPLSGAWRSMNLVGTYSPGEGATHAQELHGSRPQTSLRLLCDPPYHGDTFFCFWHTRTTKETIARTAAAALLAVSFDLTYI
jgi:hypothetical protein